jgi:hypothetical protein
VLVNKRSNVLADGAFWMVRAGQGAAFEEAVRKGRVAEPLSKNERVDYKIAESKVPVMTLHSISCEWGKAICTMWKNLNSCSVHRSRSREVFQ